MAFDPTWSPAGSLATTSWGQGAVWRATSTTARPLPFKGIPLTNDTANAGELLQRAGILPKAPIAAAGAALQSGAQLISGNASSTGLLYAETSFSYNAQGRIQSRSTPGYYVSTYA